MLNSSRIRRGGIDFRWKGLRDCPSTFGNIIVLYVFLENFS
ncbi:Uncharacterized protein APZ42_028545 [Daphnia magna]|uniref:Uncharacterized protein n=1 Tax=Daphnia magna TaxID=35525 RepID=A0A164QF05_9CRUS|nr:Uncharacterized protein APZ42_028545 [Daphnia magna]